MDFNKLITRVKGLLMTPKREWPQIAAEPATTSSIYTGYVLWLAAIPAIFNFIRGRMRCTASISMPWPASPNHKARVEPR